MSESAVRVDGGEASQWELRVYCKVRFVACQQNVWVYVEWMCCK